MFYIYMGFPDGSVSKESTRIHLPCRRQRRCEFNPWIRKTLWRRKRQPTPVFLPRKFHGQKSLIGYNPRGPKESDMTENMVHTHRHTHTDTHTDTHTQTHTHTDTHVHTDTHTKPNHFAVHLKHCKLTTTF